MYFGKLVAMLLRVYIYRENFCFINLSFRKVELQGSKWSK